MANTSAATGLTVQQWDDDFFKEYIRDNRFAKYMGTSPSSMIQVNEQLGKKKGDTVTFALVNRLTGNGVSGSQTLEGNEEDMTSRSHTVTINKYRNGVVVPEIEEQKSAIGLRNAARSVLLDWSMEHTRDKVIAALLSINGVAYASATAAQRDAWLDDNVDRVLFGAANSNLSTSAPAGGATYDHSASLASVDSSGDKLTASRLQLMKRIAITADPKVRPIRTKGDEEWYVVFAHPRAFRDLKADSTITQAQREVSLKAQNSRLFNGGDIIYDGMIVREIAEIPTFDEGNSGDTVAPVFLCGAQAIACAFAKRWKSVDETRDYGDKRGVAIEALYEINKMTFGSGSSDTSDLKDHGVVTGWFAATADA